MTHEENQFNSGQEVMSKVRSEEVEAVDKMWKRHMRLKMRRFSVVEWSTHLHQRLQRTVKKHRETWIRRCPHHTGDTHSHTHKQAQAAHAAARTCSPGRMEARTDCAFSQDRP